MLFVNSEELSKVGMFMIYDLFGATSACQILFTADYKYLKDLRSNCQKNTACQVVFTVNYLCR